MQGDCPQERIHKNIISSSSQLARQITTFGQTVSGLDQYAVLKFGEALEIVAKILSDNAGKKGRVETLTGLIAAQENV